ncbi:unnamed protein product, partial [Ectocarpus sp. 8 AP-2014]
MVVLVPGIVPVIRLAQSKNHQSFCTLTFFFSVSVNYLGTYVPAPNMPPPTGEHTYSCAPWHLRFQARTRKKQCQLSANVEASRSLAAVVCVHASAAALVVPLSPYPFFSQIDLTSSPTVVTTRPPLGPGETHSPTVA